jgi:alpha-tubulin suppressor-like RCC1 family protein
MDLSGIRDVSCGSTHSMFLKSNGTVLTCGSNSYGELGLETTIDTSIATQINSLSGIAKISAGYSHSLFLKDDGTVYGCGLNIYGQLGNGTSTTSGVNPPSLVLNLSNVGLITGGSSHSLFVQNNGNIWACGSNSDGQLGDNGSVLGFSNIPVQTINACLTTDISLMEEKPNVFVYPNPTNEYLFLDVSNANDKLESIIIFDMLGNRIYNSTVKDENFKINTTAFNMEFTVINLPMSRV